MTDHTPEPCGCRVRWGSVLRIRPYDIVYCPIHAAAFEYKSLASAQGAEIARLREELAKAINELELASQGALKENEKEPA